MTSVHFFKDFKELPYNYNQNKMIKVHSLLLSTPDLIETYSVILEYLREIMERLTTATLQNIRKTIRVLKSLKICLYIYLSF